MEHVRATADIARRSVSVVEWLEHVLHRWTSYVIVPVFALANAGIAISVDGLRDAAGSSVAWGILVGLVVGKPVGVTIARRIAVRSGLAHDGGETTGSNVGIAAAAGVGFTVALFIADLAFTDDDRRQEAKLAILVASIVAAGASLVAFRVSARRVAPAPTTDPELS